MSDNRSWKSSYQSNTEIAMETVRHCVNLLTKGRKTDTALRDLAPVLGISHRRIRTLYHRDGVPVVLNGEWLSLRYRAGLFFLNEAQRFRALGDKCEAYGEDLVSTQLEFSWEAPECSGKSGFGGAQRKHVA
jgi:hypothetical protein